LIDNKTRSGSFGFVIKNKGEIMSQEQMMKGELTKCKKLEQTVKQNEQYFARLWDENFNLRNRLQVAEFFINSEGLKNKYCAKIELGGKI